jgi:hypothetical protein
VAAYISDQKPLLIGEIKEMNSAVSSLDVPSKRVLAIGTSKCSVLALTYTGSLIAPKPATGYRYGRGVTHALISV